MDNRFDEFDSTAVFSRVLSHDLGALVRTAKHLSGYVREDILREDLDSAMHALGMLDIRLANLDRFIAELIRFYRAGQRPILIEEFSATAIVRDIFQRGQLPVTAQLRITASQDRVLTDRVMLQTVLKELIENAHVHHPDPEDLILSVDISQSEDSRVIMIIRDNGRGLGRLDPRVALQPFAKSTTRQNAAGLGLAICKRELDAVGGEICIQPARGGLSVALVLPAVADIPALPEKPEITPTKGDSGGPNLRIV
ncbi:MAG: ATP-binding protein [Pseudomonadota bacterium]